MKNWISIVLVFILGINLSGCSTSSSPVPDKSKAYIGLFSGAIIGGLAGSALNERGGARVTAITLGAVVGAIAGGGIGLLLSDMDRERAEAAAGNQNRSQANNWQHATSPYAPRVQTASKAPPVKATVAENKTVAPVKQEPNTKAVAAVKKEPEVKQVAPKEVAALKKEPEAKQAMPDKTEKDPKVMAANDKKLDKDKTKPISASRHLPSFQWFVNDEKHEEVG